MPTLYLGGNKIIDVKPLARLSKLTSLDLDRNQITDLKPLAALKNLSQLYVNRNPIKVQTCPLKPDNICRF